MVETGRFALVVITPGLCISCGVPYRMIEFAQETGGVGELRRCRFHHSARGCRIPAARETRCGGADGRRTADGFHEFNILTRKVK